MNYFTKYIMPKQHSYYKRRVQEVFGQVHHEAIKIELCNLAPTLLFFYIDTNVTMHSYIFLPLLFNL